MASFMDRLKENSRPYWDFLADWVHEAAVLVKQQYDVDLIVSRKRTQLIGQIDPNTGLPYYEEITIAAAAFPRALYWVGGQFYLLFEGSAEELAKSILKLLSALSGVAIPPVAVRASETPAAPATKVGLPIQGHPGWFGLVAGDVAPLGTVERDALGVTYVKKGNQTPFGWALHWEVAA